METYALKEFAIKWEGPKINIYERARQPRPEDGKTPMVPAGITEY